MFFGNLAAHRQAHRACSIACKFQIENFGQHRLGNPFSRVRNRNRHLAIRSARLNGNAPGALDGLRGIDQQSEENLIDPPRKTRHLRQASVISHQFDVALQFVAHKRERALDPLVDIHLLPFRFIQPRKISEARNEFAHAGSASRHHAIGLVYLLQGRPNPLAMVVLILIFCAFCG